MCGVRGLVLPWCCNLFFFVLHVLSWSLYDLSVLSRLPGVERLHCEKRFSPDTFVSCPRWPFGTWPMQVFGRDQIPALELTFELKTAPYIIPSRQYRVQPPDKSAQTLEAYWLHRSTVDQIRQELQVQGCLVFSPFCFSESCLSSIEHLFKSSYMRSPPWVNVQHNAGFCCLSHKESSADKRHLSPHLSVWCIDVEK